jgi:hypothetical protein
MSHQTERRKRHRNRVQSALSAAERLCVNIEAVLPDLPPHSAERLKTTIGEFRGVMKSGDERRHEHDTHNQGSQQ